MTEEFWGMLMLCTALQWILYAKYKDWKRNRTPEPRQGKPVDRCLYHLITDKEQPWQAGDCWERKGRGMIVALERQGLNHLLSERDVSDHKPAFVLGYTVREEEDQKELDRLTKQLQRREEANKRLQSTIDELKEELSRKPEPVTVTAPERNTDPFSEWGQCAEPLEAVMQRKGWQRIAEPAPVEIVEDSTQNEELTTDYKRMKGKEKIETMLQLKAEGKTNSEIAQLFGMTTGGVKDIISKNRPRPDNIIPLEFGDSEKVSTGF